MLKRSKEQSFGEPSRENPRPLRADGTVTSGSNQQTIQRLASGGLPDDLRTGLESLSGLDLSDVRVHRNSSRPKQLKALAYTEGSEIFLGPGQDQHLSHEGWHVVQQKQGRVRPTGEVSGVALNDDPALEKEADRMGARASRTSGPVVQARRAEGSSASPVRARQSMKVQAGPMGVRMTARSPDVDALDGPVVQCFGVAIKPAIGRDENDLIIQDIVIDGRPPGPDKKELESFGGSSFHHQSAVALDEKSIKRFVGRTVRDVYEELSYEPLPDMAPLPKVAVDTPSIMLMIELNNYFSSYLELQAKSAMGFLAGKGGHSAQGGVIGATMKEIEQRGLPDASAVFHALVRTFELQPGLSPVERRDAAAAHIQKFWAALQDYWQAAMSNPDRSLFDQYVRANDTFKESVMRGGVAEGDARYATSSSSSGMS